MKTFKIYKSKLKKLKDIKSKKLIKPPKKI